MPQSSSSGTAGTNLPDEPAVLSVPMPAFSQPSLPATMPTDSGPPRDQNHEHLPPPALQETPKRASRRLRYGKLDWTGQKSLLQKLYLDEDRSLKETMEIMKATHSFNASMKLYKDKFHEWKWHKNLPHDRARFMSCKAKKRKRDLGKDTLFTRGNQQWTSEDAEQRLARKKRQGDDGDMMEIATPESVSYKTPKQTIRSPNGLDSVSDVEIAEREQIASPGSHTSGTASCSLSESDCSVEPKRVKTLSFKWNGLSYKTLRSMYDAARQPNQQHTPNEVENAYHKVLQGYRHILGPAHEDANKVAYALASLYVEEDRPDEADSVIEEVTRIHIESFGFEHRRTQQHILHTVELLKTWDRPEDALALVSQSREQWEMAQSRTTRSGHHPRASPCIQPTNNGPGASSDAGNELETITAMVALVGRDQQPANINLALEFSRSHVTAKNQAIETVLLAVILQCSLTPRHLVIQGLRARSELLSLYAKLGAVGDHVAAFQEAKTEFNVIWAISDWDGLHFESLEVVEAGLQLAVSLLKAGYQREAKTMIAKVKQTSMDVFGAYDERTIWVLTSIGLAYQQHMSWDAAEPWFQHAYAAALGKWDPDDGMVKSLQAALEVKHFRYLTTEGRPFKAVFGICGVTIRPGRLHLD